MNNDTVIDELAEYQVLIDKVLIESRIVNKKLTSLRADSLNNTSFDNVLMVNKIIKICEEFFNETNNLIYQYNSKTI